MASHGQTVFIGLCLAATVIGVYGVERIKRPTTAQCNKENTLFNVKKVYTYAYTMTASSGFIGTSPMRSGSKLTCRVILKVPRKCEIIMKLNSCMLQGVDSTSQDGYINLNSDEFVQQLERYPLYFQINEGIIVKDTIVADLGETVTILNIKRGILSAIQFDINFLKQLDEKEKVEKEMIDVYGTCPTSYIYNPEDTSQIITLRNLPECQLHQIFYTQFQTLSTTLRALTGGIIQDKIKEKIYPFDTRVYCQHSLENKKRLKQSSCTHQHFFKPSAFVDENQTIYSAITNVSQTLILENIEHKGQNQPNRVLAERKIIDIGFDFGDQSDNVELLQLEDAMAELKNKYVSNDVENLPSSFESLILLMRRSTRDVLKDFMKILYSCDKACSKEEFALQKFYTDGLLACGTVNCQLEYFECINHGHLDKIQSSEILYGLASLLEVDEAVKLKMLEYCKTSGTMRCWLPLGTVLSKTEITDNKIQPDSVFGLTVSYARDELKKHCSAGTLDVTPRHLIIAVKVLGNIGLKKIKDNLSDDVDFQPIFKECLNNKVIPYSVNYVILQEMLEDYSIQGYKNMPATVVEDLFGVLNDDSLYNNLRTLSFSILSKTSDEAVIQRLLQKMKDGDTDQLMAYMVNTVYMLYENDQPDHQHIREAWKKQSEPPRFERRQEPSMSKPVYFGNFFKIPVSEVFGSHLAIDLIYDPTRSQFSSLSVQLNYYYEKTRNNVFEFTMNVHGFDLDVETMTKMFGKLMQGGLQEKDEGEFPKFQQHLLKKVMKLLEKVNSPKIPDSDVYFDIKTQGKSVAFISMQEVLALARHITIPDLLSIDKDAFKATELLSIVKIMPTCGGVPLNMTVKASGWNLIKNNIKSNLKLFLAGKGAELTFGLKQYILFNFVVSGEASIPIGNFHSSGLRAALKFGSERDIQIDASLAKTEDGYPKFNFDFAPISEGKNSETVFYARGSMFVSKDTTWDEIQEDKTVQTTYNSCLNEKFQMALGRSFCTTFEYPKVAWSTEHPYFPLSGPFDMEVVMEKVDSVDLYHLEADYTNTLDTFCFHFQNSAQGTTLNRLSTLDINVDKNDRSVHVDLVAAELDIEYHWVYNVYSWETFEISEVFQKDGERLFGYRIGGIKNETADTRNFNLNASLPYLSWDLDITGPYKYADGNNQRTVVFTYYCSKLQPLLYLFHLSPEHALTNDDRTVVTFDFNGNTAKQSLALSLELLDVKVAMSMNVEGGDMVFSPSFTSTANGIQRTLSATMIFETSGVLSVVRAKSIDVDGKDFGLDITSTIDGSLFDFDINLNVEYNKDKVEKALSRQKRSLRGVFERIMSFEQTVIERFYQFEELIRGRRSANGQSVIVSSKESPPTVVPDFPSIWEMPKWNSNLDIKGKIKSTKGPRDRNPSMYMALILSFLHPWNGEYRKLEGELVFGLATKPTMRSFRFWTSGDVNMTYTNLDGNPVLDDAGKPLVFNIGGETHINRQMGSFFDFGIHHHDPHADMKYEIMFDWDALSHKEPLVHVVSHAKNDYLSIFDHEYEETLAIEQKHWIHSVEFSHEMLAYKLATDIQFSRSAGKDQFALTQTGSLKYPGKSLIINASLVDPNSKPLDIKYIYEYQDTAVPDHVWVYTYFIKPMQFGVIIGEKMSPDADELILWTYTYDILETSMKLEITWDQKVQEETKKFLMDQVMLPGTLLKTFANKVANDIRLPFMQQPILLSSVTLDDIAKKYLEPSLKGQINVYSKVMANFVPKDEREETVYKQNRLSILYSLFEKLRKQEKNKQLLVLQRLNYIILNHLSKFFLMHGSRIQNTQRFADVIEKKRKAEYWWTLPFIVEKRRDRFNGFDSRENVEYISKAVGSLKREKGLDSNFAVIFKHRSTQGTDMGLNVKTFGGYVYGIPVAQAAKSTYLLAADVLKSQYSLVATPSGITLISNKGSLTISFDNDVFLNDCLQPSSETQQHIGGDTILWERKGEEILVETSFGITITCDMSWSKVCFIGLKNQYRNTTIGFLGTNNNDAFLDRRSVEGNVIRDNSMFVSTFCLSKCDDVLDNPLLSEDCLKRGVTDCDNPMSKYSYTYIDCIKKVGNFFQVLKELCRQNTGCDMDLDSPCMLIKSFRSFCQRQGFIKSVTRWRNKEVTCLADPVYDPQLASLERSLDVVFVISLHKDMAQYSLQASDYIEEFVGLITAYRPSFHDKRIGIVTFGGDGKQKKPILQQIEVGGKLYFSEINDLDMLTLHDKLGATGKEDTGINAFKALKMAAQLPFDTGANKVIVLLTSNEQGSDDYDIETLKEELVDQGITLHVFTTYPLGQLNQKHVIGLNHDGEAITSDGASDRMKVFPQNDFAKLVKATTGSLWDLKAITWESAKGVLVNHLVDIELNKHAQSCPAA